MKYHILPHYAPTASPKPASSKRRSPEATWELKPTRKERNLSLTEAMEKTHQREQAHPPPVRSTEEVLMELQGQIMAAGSGIPGFRCGSGPRDSLEVPPSASLGLAMNLNNPKVLALLQRGVYTEGVKPRAPSPVRGKLFRALEKQGQRYWTRSLRERLLASFEEARKMTQAGHRAMRLEELQKEVLQNIQGSRWMFTDEGYFFLF